MYEKKKLIINADDWGLSPLFNKGILDLMKKGIVASTTVMVGREYIEPEKINGLFHISVGLHLELPRNASQKDTELQIEKFADKFGKAPTHLDGHQHCHILPENIENVAEVAKKYSLPVRSRFEGDRKFFSEKKIKTTDLYLGWHPEYFGKFFEELRNVKERVTEIVCHPGYFDRNCSYPYNRQREQELEILSSDAFNEVISDFQLINYKSL